MDINSDIYPVKQGEFYKIGIAASYQNEETSDYYSIADMKNTLFDEYDYVMHGKVFRYEIHNDESISQYISFGGLILRVKGDNKAWSSIYGKSPEVDQKVFLLMKQAAKQS